MKEKAAMIEDKIAELEEERDWWHNQVKECHKHLSALGIGKEHWSLLGRLELVVRAPWA